MLPPQTSLAHMSFPSSSPIRCFFFCIGGWPTQRNRGQRKKDATAPTGGHLVLWGTSAADRSAMAFCQRPSASTGLVGGRLHPLGRLAPAPAGDHLVWSGSAAAAGSIRDVIPLPRPSAAICAPSSCITPWWDLGGDRRTALGAR